MSKALCHRNRRLKTGALVSITMLMACLQSSHSYAAESTYQLPKSSILKPSSDFDFFAYSKKLHKDHQARHAFRQGVNPQKWQTTARAALKTLLALPESAPAPLNAKLGEKLKCAVVIDKRVYKYTRQEILYYSRPNYPVGGYFLLPDNANNSKAKYSAVVCMPGHGSRVQDIVGLQPDGNTRSTLSADYQHDLAVQCVANGYATIAIESLGLGSRASYSKRKEFPQGQDCNQFDGPLNLYGDSLIGYRVYDALRAIDYLQSRNDINKDSIATVGVSAGGAISLFAAALDTRVKCAVVSCFLNDINSSLLSHIHCGCNYVPNLGKEFRLSDIGGLIAPRLLLIEASKNDHAFPLSGAKLAYEETKKIYSALKVPQNVILFQTKGDHQFDGYEAFKRLKLDLR
ncbi:MAG: hypothetical protein C0469_14265 [Cyanobacteria bacterium DS2.3.42]|nr:hypothetical protein [Cyanobacteria bacterium DS2.3.42]